MQLSFQYGTRNIAFDVVYKKRKTMAIAVEPPDRIIVTAPVKTPEDLIISKVKNKANWIVQRLYSFKDMNYQKINREFVNGESFMYLGRNYSLQIQIDSSIKKPEIKLYRGKFYVVDSTAAEVVIKEAMEQWYREKALRKVKERIKYYQHMFSKKPLDIKVKEQKKRWGSCTHNNELLFNWKIIMAPSYVLDYIIVHEMCHMCYKNHSQEFWNMVASILPDYEMRKEWLKNNGVKLDL
ncbi:M48 family metallopeptidase [Clostridium sp. ZS2-4]|uniref:M48 family metallopeptidase n=1 Tax=Clostridium sp. ZS2-4 TaxID=2987703 RepID=UPI00227B8B8F|nr:SprT family zinc-dependent metalloprotease [Clostridium sp. ZS2-4]MCY6355370.1 SprT family zinc-dependent metalloprotease [Clostridium sp. ZS2-4]